MFGRPVLLSSNINMTLVSPQPLSGRLCAIGHFLNAAKSYELPQCNRQTSPLSSMPETHLLSVQLLSSRPEQSIGSVHWSQQREKVE